MESSMSVWILLRSYGFKQRMKALLKKLLNKIVLFIFLRPNLKNFVIQVIFKFGVSQRIKIWLNDLSISGGLVNEKIHKSPLVFKNLSPRTQAIYNDLIKSIKSQSEL